MVNPCGSTAQLVVICRKNADLKGRSLALRRGPAQPALLLPVCGRGILPRRPQHGGGGSQDHPLLCQSPLHAALRGEEPRRHPRCLHCANCTEPLRSGGWGHTPPGPPWHATLRPNSEGGGEGLRLLLLSARHPPLHLFRYAPGTGPAAHASPTGTCCCCWEMMFCRIDTYILSLVVITNDVYMKKALRLDLMKHTLVVIPDLMNTNQAQYFTKSVS